MKNFDSWNPTEGFPEGSGRSEKIWLISQDNKVGLFKFPKTEYTSEHISERLAYTLGKALEIECAEVEIGTRDGRIGSISYLITDQKAEELKEGIQFIQAQSPLYRDKDLYDPGDDTYYSVDHIFDSTAQQVEKEVWVEMLLFDFLIGNSDRHHNNWAIVSTRRSNRRSPLYDNGSSLCSYIMEDNLDKYFGKDMGPVAALTDTQSKSTVRIDKHNKKNPTHREVVMYLLEKYPKTTEPIARKMLESINSGLFCNLLSEFTSDLLSERKKKLIQLFLERKTDILRECLRERGEGYGN